MRAAAIPVISFLVVMVFLLLLLRGMDHSCHQLVVDPPENGCDQSHNAAAFAFSRCVIAARGAADPSKRLGRRCSEREKER